MSENPASDMEAATKYAEVCQEWTGGSQANLGNLARAFLALREDETSHKEVIKECYAEIDRQFKRAEAAEAQIAKLREALVRYGEHPPDCSQWTGEGRDYEPLKCDCGLAAALESKP